MTERHPEELLAPFVDGELTGEDRRAVEAHVASCPVCAEEIGLARRAAMAVRGLDEVPSPAGLGTPAIQQARPASRLVLRLGWAAAGAAAAAIVAVFAVSQLTHPATRAANGPVRENAPQATAADAGGGPLSGALPLYTESDADYSQADLQDRVRNDAASLSFKAAETDQATDDSLTTAAGKAAIRCVDSAGLEANEGARLIQIELARFEGHPAYVVLFWRDEDSLELWVVDKETCEIRFLANA